MFLSIAGFEFRYQLKSPVFWVAVVLFFLIAFTATSVEGVQVGGSNSNLHRNAPYVLANLQMVLAIFFMFASTAMVAGVVVRDDETGFGPILRSSRITKFDYLYGRFVGAFGGVLLAFASVPLGAFLGSLAPWLDKETLGPVRIGDYLYAYAVLAAPTLLLTSALFFAVSTATRSMMATYVAVVGLLIIWLVATAVTNRPELERLMAVVEPFGAGAYGYMTKYWTAADRNSLNLPFSGPLLWSRLIWTSVALVLLAGAHRLYRFETPGAKRREKASPDTPAPSGARLTEVAVASGDAGWLQFRARTRMDMGQVFKSPAFFVLLALGLFNSVGSLWFANSLYESDIYPVTRVMIEMLEGSFTFIPVIVAVFYAGELVWRERDRRTDEIIDSTPAPDWAFATPKILAITLVLFSMLLVSVVMAMIVQTLKGWNHYELGHYLAWYVLPTLVGMFMTTVLAVFVQSLAPNKYAGYAIMLVYMVVRLSMNGLHLEDYLYRFGGSPPVPLSDMNGEGHFAVIAQWFRAYWLCISLIMVLLVYALWRRGKDVSLIPRLRRLPSRLAGLKAASLASLAVVAVGLGGFIFYNTHVLNPYVTSKDQEVLTADLEKALLKYESLPQPKITDVRLNVDIYPHDNRVVTRGIYVIENKTAAPIRDLHIRFDQWVKVRGLSVEGARPKETLERFNYRIFTFDAPMAPGERRQLSFETERVQRGFRNSGNGWTQVYDNGTFLNDRQIAPNLGMDRSGLLQDRVKRRKYGLPPELRPARLEDESARRFNMLGKDSDWVNSDITVSTVADQTPMAPGYKLSDKVEGGRRTARFRTEAPILRFFSIQSARYALKRETYKGVDLAIYYHPDHEWNVDRMIKALKVGLDYDQANFSPYQFHQARILEFPAYENFAQSYANTIPYSEGIGWILDTRNPDKIDMVTYVTAHELGHQWWAHQLIGSDQQGATMLDETLAQYSALMAMEKLYGQAQIRKFLKLELDNYLRNRGGEVLEELPLERVENQPYIHYRKGSLVMYRLKEELGEDKVNHALRLLLTRYAFKGAPYPQSRELVQLFRDEARPDQQQLITDLFEKITLYDLKARDSKVVKRPDGRYDVTLNFEAKKLYADGHGKETAAPMKEWVDVGLFTREPGKEGYKPEDMLLMKRIAVHSGAQSVTLTVDKAPSLAGIDPYNKLIDRNSDDNITAVKR
jgi:aminopeptidase N